MKRLFLSFVLMISAIICSASSFGESSNKVLNVRNQTYLTQMTLERLNKSTFYLITFSESVDKFKLADGGELHIVLNNDSIVDLKPTKEVLTPNETNSAYAVYYITTNDLNKIILYGVKSVSRKAYPSNRIETFKDKEFETYVIKKLNDMYHNMN